MGNHRFAGKEIAEIGQGTWQIESHAAQALATLQRGLDLGLRHIDTAEMYGSGGSERIVGRAIQGRRDEVFLVSKVMPSNASYEGTIKACERSLKNLGTGHLDSYLLHWRGSYPLTETLHAFADLVAQGKIVTFGVSNFDVEDLDEAEQIVGPGRIACNQVLYHLRERSIEARVLPWCRKRGIAVVGCSPFGHGNFPEEGSTEGDLLAEIGRRYGKTARQVALRFLMRDPDLFTIPKSTQIEHVEENAGALGFELTEEDIGRIDAAFPVKARRSLPML